MLNSSEYVGLTVQGSYGGGGLRGIVEMWKVTVTTVCLDGSQTDHHDGKNSQPVRVGLLYSDKEHGGLDSVK